MYIINLTIHHANDKSLEESVELEAETLKGLQSEVRLAIETSYENANHLLKKDKSLKELQSYKTGSSLVTHTHYPAKQLEMTLSVGKNNVIKNKESLESFIRMNDQYIKELISKEKTHVFFKKKDQIFDEEDYLPPFMNIVQLEKHVNTITRKYHIWKKEQDEFEAFVKQKRESKKPSP